MAEPLTLGRVFLSKIQLMFFDFDGVFTDNTVYVAENALESVRCWRSDGLGIQRMRAAGVESFIVSTETNPVVTTRARKIGVQCMQAVADKAVAISEVCRVKGFDPIDVGYVGNDINDIPAFNMVGFPIAVADAYPEVLPHVRYHTKTAGGYGAVREVCDEVVWARQVSGQ